MDLRTNNDYLHIKQRLVRFYNRDGECLLRGTNWVFTYSPLRVKHKLALLFL